MAGCWWPVDELFGFRWLVVGGWWLKERDSKEEKQRDGGQERKSCKVIYYIILLGKIYYFNDKIETGDNWCIVKWYSIIDKVAFKMVNLDIFEK